MKDNEESNIWVSALKVLLGIAVLVGGVGLALWYANQRPVSSPALEQAVETVRKANPNAASSGDGGWGISHDSPARR